MWIGFAIGQLYILGRLWVKLVFWASETALFQSRLAHAGYIARPQPVWPDLRPQKQFETEWLQRNDAYRRR